MSDTKTALIAAAVGSLFSLVGTIGAASFGYFNKDKELDIQLVNVGLSILRGEATGDKDTIQARRFALRLLKKYADVDIPKDEAEDWAKTGITPFEPTSGIGGWYQAIPKTNEPWGGMLGKEKADDFVVDPNVQVIPQQ
ncbi:MAG: hypothetical protein ABJJ37_27010 [Roseibium sp.]